MDKNISKQRKTELTQRMYKWLLENEDQFKELMAYYRCALMEVSTKFNVLQEELSLKFDRNPIESIKTRLKTPESILEKLDRKGLDITIENLERYINDVAGLRVICSFPSDLYQLADALLMQDDVILIEKKDYMQNPKPNGYRSLHLIIAIPIFLHDHKKVMTVEVQFRTIAMDWWASLEHKILYKKNLPEMPVIEESLLRCALRSYYLDLEMESIYKAAIGESDNTKPLFSNRKMLNEE
ncbi:MAG: GTP pyrophosphokinase [Candidatus Alectryocaccobium sp.]|nr:GTP pyrophosphokinase family protein [Lachnospiraceae bacterium]MDY6221544.1 GTP pyrophosphokinase family protein [Candidatus Alectryocaccobium sp.]